MPLLEHVYGVVGIITFVREYDCKRKVQKFSGMRSSSVYFKMAQLRVSNPDLVYVGVLKQYA